ncbi:MAG: alpha/beta hydrolase-fold protein, partial [Bacteroidota bacterium]
MKYSLILLTFISLLSAQTFESVIQKLEQSPLEQRKKIIEQYLNTKRTAPIVEQDSIIHFVLYGVADSVSVIGNLQQWLTAVPLKKIECGQFSFFYSTFTAPPDARLDYQLIINGKFRTDPQNPRITPSGFGPHSEVQMPKFNPTPYIYYRSDIQHGVIDSLAPLLVIPPPLNHYLIPRRSIKVYRPAGYDTLSNLPTVYVHDGFEYIDFAFAPTILDNLIAEGRIPPVIAVFIPPVDRGQEYMGNALGR